MIGFLEESAGVRSMTRLAIAVLLALASIIVGVLCWYVVRSDSPSAGVIGALAGVVSALVLNGAVAIIHRNGSGDDKA